MTGPPNNIQLPPLPDDERAAWERIQAHLLDMREAHSDPINLLEYQGVGFAPLGGIQAITGQKKNGKTWVLTQIMAAILGDGGERQSAKLRGLKISDRAREYLGEREPTVLYVDTEMEKLYTAKVARRVHWLCGWNMQENNPRLHTLWLRTTESAKEKFQLLNDAIDYLRPTAIFIDGIRDLIEDFNDMNQAMPLISSLMKTATERECCIWNVLHLNPRPNNDDESKMRGHLGTELGNKVTDTFASYKKKSSEGKMVFTVKHLDARGKDVPEWQFEITDDAGGLGIPRILDAPATTAEPERVVCDDPEKIRLWLTEGQRDIDWPATGAEVKKLLKERGGITSNAQLQHDLIVARNRRFILAQSKEEMSEGQTHPKFKLNDNEILPF